MAVLDPNAKIWTRVITDNFMKSTAELNSYTHRTSDIFLDMDIAGLIFTYLPSSVQEMEKSVPVPMLQEVGLEVCDLLNYMSLNVNMQTTKVLRMSIVSAVGKDNEDNINLDIMFHFDRETNLFDNEIVNIMCDNGLDIDINTTKGLDVTDAFRRFCEVGLFTNKMHRYFVYRGIFTTSYILSRLWGHDKMPKSTREFSVQLSQYLIEIYDIMLVLYVLRSSLRGNTVFGNQFENLQITPEGIRLIATPVTENIADVYGCFFPSDESKVSDLLGETVMLINIERRLENWFSENGHDFNEFLFKNFGGMMWGIACAD